MYYYVIFSPDEPSNAYSDNYEVFSRFLCSRRLLFEEYFGVDSWRNAIFFHRYRLHNNYDTGMVGVFPGENFEEFYGYISEQYGVLFGVDNYILQTCTDGEEDPAKEVYYTDNEIAEYAAPTYNGMYRAREEFVYCSINDLVQRLGFVHQILPVLQFYCPNQQLIQEFTERFLDYCLVYIGMEGDSFELIREEDPERLEDLVRAYNSEGLIDDREYLRAVLSGVYDPLPFGDEGEEEKERNDLAFMWALFRHIEEATRKGGQ